MTETQFKNKVEQELDNLSAWYIKYWAGNKFTKEGIPDILACIDGKFYGIELKKDNGRPSLLQLVKLREIRKAGGIGVLLYPEDLERFKSFVKTDDNVWYSKNICLQNEWFEKLNK